MYFFRIFPIAFLEEPQRRWGIVVTAMQKCCGGQGKCFLCQQITRIFTARPWSILPHGGAVIGLSRKMGLWWLGWVQWWVGGVSVSEVEKSLSHPGGSGRGAVLLRGQLAFPGVWHVCPC